MRHLFAAAVCAALTAMPAWAQWTPSGPIKIQIGFAAGGGADTLARLIAEDMAAEYGWNVIPENLAGGGGSVMARALMDAPADGLTLGMGVTDTFAYDRLAAKDPGFTLDDFDFLTTIAGTQMGVVAKADRGWTNLSDVIAAAKAGEELSFGSMTARLSDGAYYISKVNDVNFNIVSGYKGGRAVLNAIIADDVDIGWVAGPQAKGVAAGDLVNLVNGEDQPLKVSPDAEMLSAVGVDFFFGATFIMMAPDGLPEDARTALTDAIATVIRKDGTKSNEFINRVFVLKVKSGEDAAAYVAKESADSEALLEATAN
ncbi:MAG: tripartite tricarboxylate transporter substrate binding protein [Silicimonas sp.]|nr:tripartite tricarboxylate transporter substrate binding protein [Silicimonas sp.]